MLQQLADLVKENAGGIISSNPDIPAEKKEEAFQVAGASVVDGLTSVLSQGGVAEVLKLFSGKADVAESPVAQTASQSFADRLSSQLGVNASQAGGLASSIIPMILGKLVNRTNDPNDKGFDLQDMLNQFSGGKTAGLDIGGLLSKFKGLDRDGDGDVDLNDLAGMFTGGGSATGGSSSGGAGGGLGGLLKGLFK